MFTAALCGNSLLPAGIGASLEGCAGLRGSPLDAAQPQWSTALAHRMAVYLAAGFGLTSLPLGLFWAAGERTLLPDSVVWAVAADLADWMPTGRKLQQGDNNNHDHDNANFPWKQLQRLAEA